MQLRFIEKELQENGLEWLGGVKNDIVRLQVPERNNAGWNVRWVFFYYYLFR